MVLEIACHGDLLFGPRIGADYRKHFAEEKMRIAPWGLRAQ